MANVLTKGSGGEKAGGSAACVTPANASETANLTLASGDPLPSVLCVGSGGENAGGSAEIA